MQPDGITTAQRYILRHRIRGRQVAGRKGSVGRWLCGHVRSGATDRAENALDWCGPAQPDMVYLRDSEGLRGTDRTILSMPVGGHSKTVQRQRNLPRPGLTLTVFHRPSSDVQSRVAPLRCLKGYRLVCRAQQQAAVGTRQGRGGAVLWELVPGCRPNWSRLKSLAQGMPIVSYSADLAAAVAQRSRRFGFTSHLSAPLNCASNCSRRTRVPGTRGTQLPVDRVGRRCDSPGHCSQLRAADTGSRRRHVLG